MRETLLQCLADHALTQPDRIAIVAGGEELTYGDLYRLVEGYAAFLSGQGVTAGDVVMIRTMQRAEYFIAYFAIHLVGAIAAPLERDVTSATMQHVARQLGARWAVSDLHPEGVTTLDSSSILSDARLSVRPDSSRQPRPTDTADILFTTGTTGRSKGVMLSHRAWMANADNLIHSQGFSSELMFITTGPINHIGNLSKAYPVFLLGATLYVMEGMKSLEDFYLALDYHSPRVSSRLKRAAFLVPASIRMLLQMTGDRLSTYSDVIDFIETGAAPIAQNDMQTLARLLPHSRLFNTYASSETGILCTYNFNDGISHAGCVGRVMKYSQVFITDDERREVTRPGVIGFVTCRGATLMSGYAGDEALTRSVLTDATLYTTDLGYFSAEGLLFLTGRQSDIINVGGLKVSPLEVEDVAMSMPEVKDCLCIARSHKVMGQALKLLVVPAAGHHLDKRALATYLKSRLESYKVPLLYEEITEIRRTYNGKPDRKAYAEE